MTFAILWRAIALVAVGGLMYRTFDQALKWATLVTLGLIAGLLILSLIRLWHQQTHLLKELINALRHPDPTSMLATPKGGLYLEGLTQEINRAVLQLTHREQGYASKLREMESLFNQLPIALFALNDSGVQALNQTAEVFDSQELNTLLSSRLVLDLEARGHWALFDGQSGQARRWVQVVPAMGVPRSSYLVVLSVENMLSSSEIRHGQSLLRMLRHEVLNTLTPITSLASSIVRDPEFAQADPQLQTKVQTLMHRAEDLMTFVGQFQKALAPVQAKKTSFDLAHFLDELVQLQRARWPNIDWSLEIVSGQTVDSLSICGDRSLLQQALNNLMRNAAQACESFPNEVRGSIRMMARAVIPAGVVAATDSVVPRGVLRIAVIDNGPGLDPLAKERLFLPLFSTKIEGQGLGLSFARQVALAHGGSLSWRSEYEPNCCFELELPLS